ncbi:MAG TPA: translation initiation factor IF-3 [Ilumatobacter sp.]|nr:translation initiation factor IF-3 [Ilumatobacter sp.]
MVAIQHRVNDRIRAREVRLIGPDGDQLGIKAVPDALRMARGLELDLVEVAPAAKPPVCRIMDYGKFRYEEAQKAKEARRKSTNVTIKEVKFRPKIGKGDFDTKMRHLLEFIGDGHKVKVTLQFRGREMAHPELGRKILDDVIAAAGPIAKVENQARMEGRTMSLVIAPDKVAQAAIKKAEAEAAQKAAQAEANPATTTEVVPEVPVEADAAQVVEEATAAPAEATSVDDETESAEEAAPAASDMATDETSGDE